MSMTLIPKPEDLTSWCASIGRTAADCAALLFRLPMPTSAYAICENQIRAHVAAELVEVDGLMDAERQHLENVAWLAFDRRLAIHTRTPPSKGVHDATAGLVHSSCLVGMGVVVEDLETAPTDQPTTHLNGSAQYQPLLKLYTLPMSC